MTRPFFHRERISDFDLFDHHAENAIAQFKARLREGYAADFQVWLSPQSSPDALFPFFSFFNA
jgi:hypothetical protein